MFPIEIENAFKRLKLEDIKQEYQNELKSNRIHIIPPSRIYLNEDEDICWHGCDKVSHVYGFSGGGGS